MLHRAPRLYGWPRSRWWLAGLRQTVAWLQPLSLVGVHRLLHRLRIRYKRGRHYVHSPDPDYDAKLANVQHVHDLVAQEPQRFVAVYHDEFTYYRRASVGYSYARSGSDEPYARQGLRSNTYRRVAGSLNTRTGLFFSWQRKRFDRWTLLRYFQALEAQYPEAEMIFVLLDNWPVHFHPDVLAGLVGSRILLVPLPTYAPWTNPAEKVWRKLNQEVLHLHEFTDQWATLQETVGAWLDGLATPSQELLRYVGLYPS